MHVERPPVGQRFGSPRRTCRFPGVRTRASPSNRGTATETGQMLPHDGRLDQRVCGQAWPGRMARESRTVEAPLIGSSTHSSA